MPITYARYVHRKPEPDVFSLSLEELEEESILLFDPVLEATTTGIGELYRRLDIGLRASEILVFRGAGIELDAAIDRDPLLPDHLGGKQVFALIGGFEPASPSPVLRPILKFAAPAARPRIENLREAELTAILQRAQAVFASNEYHYELPSGLHAEKFVRLGDALRSVYDVRRLTDWVLAYLKGDTVVIADTGSMLPLLIDLREQAASRFGWRVEISTLDRYPQSALNVAEAIAAARNRPMVADAAAAEREVGFVFVISVNSTGRLGQLFRNLGPQGAKIVVICETAQQAAPWDAVLVTVPILRWEASAEGLCERCGISPRICVHPESYELLPSTGRELVVVEKPLAESKAEFWTIADEMRAVELHVDVPYLVQGQQDYRHFGVYLNTAKLVDHPTFRKICVDELLKLNCPDVVLVPEHQNSQVVVGLCRDAHPSAFIATVPPGRLPQELMSSLAGAKRVLVADDAVVTGYTLQNLRAEVFRVTQQLGSAPELNAFVIVSRPSNEDPLKAIKRRYRGQSVGQILSGVEILLPEGKHCPWCAELRLLTSFRLLRPKGAVLNVAETRIRKLEGRLEPPLLMVNSSDARGDLQTLGSFFGILHQEAAFAAGVCAAQTVIQQLGSFGGGIQLKVIDLAMAIDAYYEGVLLASLLRTVNPVHVRFPGGDPKVDQSLLRIDPSRAYPGVLAELALAAIDNKVPSKHLRKLLDRAKSQDPWLTMLTHIMDEVRPS